MRIKILGSGQDDGIPHTGCYCDICSKARKHVEHVRLGPSIAILDSREGLCYLVDASPDFKFQLDSIREEISETKRKGRVLVSGILLTHSHLGHCAGLWHLGKESVEENDLPLYCTPSMKQFLSNNYPFSLLVQRKNIKIEEVFHDEGLRLGALEIVPIQVPHRDEVGDTVAYIIKSKKRVVYVPDIDNWTDRIMEEIRNSDIALVDGTFYSKNEIPRFEEVPHPPIRETISLLRNADVETYFIHINHTNPVNRKGKESKYVKSKGFKIAHDGMTLEI
ncbi:MAG: pyrroloquinoline quinone biosynthesis protein PqqB [Candidatus Bathyarchaeota archaeon]|nr:MAG: pyrroloquinoline quinone biosynthesis protein PqqB [Candidatus Bathyarchaeota archaeon]